MERLVRASFGLRRSDEMAIGVIATNERAMRFYERQGFRPWVVTTLGTGPDVGSSATD